jgi:hypothetical protein
MKTSNCNLAIDLLRQLLFALFCGKAELYGLLQLVGGTSETIMRSPPQTGGCLPHFPPMTACEKK